MMKVTYEGEAKKITIEVTTEEEAMQILELLKPRVPSKVPPKEPRNYFVSARANYKNRLKGQVKS